MPETEPGQYLYKIQPVREELLNEGPSSFGIVIFKAESAAQAQRIMEDDPAVRARTMRAELFPYRIALHNADAI